jgi:hypothetical protein
MSDAAAWLLSGSHECGPCWPQPRHSFTLHYRLPACVLTALYRRDPATSGATGTNMPAPATCSAAVVAAHDSEG